jgi:hypothetical protein
MTDGDLVTCSNNKSPISDNISGRSDIFHRDSDAASASGKRGVSVAPADEEGARVAWLRRAERLRLVQSPSHRVAVSVASPEVIATLRLPQLLGRHRRQLRLRAGEGRGQRLNPGQRKRGREAEPTSREEAGRGACAGGRRTMELRQPPGSLPAAVGRRPGGGAARGPAARDLDRAAAPQSSRRTR